jgi:hypothetical protein
VLALLVTTTARGGWLGGRQVGRQRPADRGVVPPAVRPAVVHEDVTAVRGVGEEEVLHEALEGHGPELVRPLK